MDSSLYIGTTKRATGMGLGDLPDPTEVMNRVSAAGQMFGTNMPPERKVVVLKRGDTYIGDVRIGPPEHRQVALGALIRDYDNEFDPFAVKICVLVDGKPEQIAWVRSKDYVEKGVVVQEGQAKAITAKDGRS